MSFVLFAICMLASGLGAVVGAGGGVIIKPMLDMLGILPVSTVSFCSGCTVLGMSLCSLFVGRNNGVALKVRTSTALAGGAVVGGIIGKWLFEIVRGGFENEKILGCIQAVCLSVLTLSVLIYVRRKARIRSVQLRSLAAILVTGIILGTTSSFLGIGGGPYNVAVLFLLFSMNAKEAAKNSLYIIVFSQLANLLTAVFTKTVPDFQAAYLICMVLGGIGGGLVGGLISKRIDNQGVERVLQGFLLIIIAINCYNIVKYTILL